MPTETTDAHMSRPRRRAWGLLKRKECWTLSWSGRILALALATGIVIALAKGIHPFLAVNTPQNARYLAVEGWVPDYALVEAMEYFKEKGYERLLTTGGQFKGAFEHDEDDTYAHLAAFKLKGFGMDAARLTVVPARLTGRDRTYTTALAVRAWIEESAPEVEAIDVITLSVHARRTRLLYTKALPEHVKTGVIAVRNREYDPKRWWQYSEGVKEIIGEGFAYIYARCLFHPPDPATDQALDRT